MKKCTIFSTLLLLTLAIFSAGSHAQTSEKWKPDLLGNGYEMRHVDQGSDYTGPVISTIIRKVCHRDSAATASDVRRGVLYVHGFNDYFFQQEMGNRFVGHGYDFYAVDLRRYGRSLTAGQKPFDVRDMASYFPDIDSALVEMQHNGISEVILMGHSTGGLTTAYFESRRHPEIIKALILNSP